MRKESSMLAKVPQANRPEHEALLKERGDAVNDCKVFLNDAWVSVLFILEKDSDDRGAAYFAAQISQEKAFWERLDPATDKGKALRDELKNDIAGPQAFDNVP